MLEPVSNKVNFPELEADILKFWEEHDTFKKSLELRKDAPEFVFYDGPPFATGLPHYGHLLAGTIKDIVPRYQTMRGHYVERRFGWDCHGLPVEYEMEQELKISGKRDIEKMGVDVFNEKCRGIVLRYTREWREIVTRMGRWVDFDHDYKTMDPAYMESIWWVFKSLWDKGLIYEGNKILPYCPRCATPLSNFETNQGYEDVQDPAITVRFAVDGRAANATSWPGRRRPGRCPPTWPWPWARTIRYVKVAGRRRRLLPGARTACRVYYKKPERLRAARGAATARSWSGWRYEPLFPYFADRRRAGRVPRGGGGLRVHRGRHGHRAHRARLRRGRLPARPGRRAAGGLPGGRGGPLHRRGAATTPAASQGGRQRTSCAG